MSRRIGRLGALFATGALLLLAILPARAAAQAAETEPRAIIAARALSSGAFIPFRVNPNFDFWPAYSLAEINNSRSHGLSGGLWPGFLVDAFSFLFGYQPQARAAIGVAESLWPDQPHEARAGTSDFGTMCSAGRDAQFALPRAVFGTDKDPNPTAKPPEPLMTGCIEMWANYGGSAPWKASVARTESDRLKAAGASDVFAFEFGVSPRIRVGSMRSSTSSDASGGASEVSSATTVLENIEILQPTTTGQPDEVLLRIGSLRATARVSTDGSAKATDATWELSVADVTSRANKLVVGRASIGGSVNGQPIAQEIPDAPAALEPVRRQLRAYGIDMQVVSGSSSRDVVRDEDGRAVGMKARAEAGGLVLRFLGDAVPPQANPAAQQVCDRVAAIDDDTFSDEPGESGSLPRVTASTSPQPNPVFENRPPYDQLPPALDVNQQVPPPAICPFVLLNRAVDVGLVLGTAQAETTYRSLPPLPPLPPFRPGTPDREIFENIGSGSDDGFGIVPPFGRETPPPAARRLLAFNEGLGADVAARVKVAYGGLLALFAFVLIGRGVFRNLMRL